MNEYAKEVYKEICKITHMDEAVKIAVYDFDSVADYEADGVDPIDAASDIVKRYRQYR